MQPKYSIAEAYEILELPEGAALEEAEAAYRSLAMQVHPDRFQNNSKMRSHAEDEQRKLNDAIQVVRSHWKASSSKRDGRPRRPKGASPTPPRQEPPSPPTSAHQEEPTSPPLRRSRLNLWQQLSIAVVVVSIVARIGMFVQSGREKSETPSADAIGRSEFGGSKAPQQGHPTTAAADEPSGTEKGSQACLSYEPAVVRLRGTITQKTFPGRPNYESVEKGDEPENEWILNVDMPLCTNKANNDTSDPDHLSEANIGKLELVFMGHQNYDTYRLMLGKTVDVTGSLFHAYTAHHHTTILLQVQDMESR